MTSLNDVLQLAAGHFQAGRLAEAEALWVKVLTVLPDQAEMHVNLAAVRRVRGRLDQAEAGYRRAIALRPDMPQSYFNLGNAQRARGNPSAAAASLLRSMRLDPGHIDSIHNLAATLQQLERFEAAAAMYRRAIALDPDRATSRVNLGGTLMILGDLRRGFAGLEWRFRLPGFPVAERVFPQPRWDGAPLRGRTLLAHAERDFGDSIQYIRYARELARQGERVVVECQPELQSLFAASLDGIAVVARGEPLPPFDCHAPLPSLPFLFGTEMDTIPAEVPYLRSPPAAPLPDAEPGAARIGLVWAARAESQTADSRTCPIEALRPLIQRQGTRFYSLQLGPRAADLAALPDGSVIDLTPRIRSFADTAAFLASLDLLVTVDTAAAHLAGALARPVWMLLPRQPAYRWHLKRADSPWYPGMRLFRQERPGDWQGLIGRVGAALDTWCKER
ncbi:MAG TPA: tetratricopeptide repeat protein [Azospirillum sp.]|nr:tetratricopeptide repeat protein [Azospirillum sp.]